MALRAPSTDARARFYTQPSFLRITGFLVLQLLFLSLALACLHTPLPVHLTSTSPEVRGAFSVVFVAWQFIAALLVGDLLLQVLSEEWSVYLLGHPFVPECDKVSTLTANIFFHIRHIFTQPTSLAYKAAFCALALLTVLRTMGPAAVTTAIAPRSFSTTVGLVKYTPTTFDPADSRDPVMMSIQRAEVITRVEQEMGTEVGWNVASTALIGRQEDERVKPDVITMYPSDVASFGFRCQWDVPQVQQDSDGLSVTGNGTQWRAWNSKSASDIVVGIYTLYNALRSFDGRSAYLFVGCDNSNWMDGCLVKLNSLPSARLPTPPQPRIKTPVPSNLTISLLTCDPKYNMTTTQIVASATSLTVSPPDHGDAMATQNNLSNQTAQLIFSAALLGALSPLSARPGTPGPMSTLAAQVFVDTHGQDIRTWTSRFNFTVDVLDLETIQKNMDAAMLSASKAFLIKPMGQGSSKFAGFETAAVPATVIRPVILLVGSRSFIYATLGLLCALIVLGLLVYLGTRNQPRIPLNLHVVLKILTHGSIPALQPDDPECSSSRDKPLPIIMGDYHPLARGDPTEDPLHPPIYNEPWYWPRRYIVARVGMFIVLQLAYYGVAIAGYVRPFNLSEVSPIPLSNFFAELKGGFIVAFTAWQTFSIALLNDILFTIFSLEWAVQADRTRTLEPGQTDRVSTLASGLFDRVRYAFTRGQGVSGMFRYALAASVILMLLSATGTGCFTLSTSAIVGHFIRIQNGSPVSSTLLSSLDTPLTREEAAILDRIAVITQLEQLEGFTWGYDMPPNWFFLWPYGEDGKAIHDSGTLKYLSTVNWFNFKCRWEAPVLKEIEMQSDIEKPVTSGIVPVKFNNVTRNAFGHSGILLAGCDSSNSSQKSAGCVLDLKGLPTRTEDNALWNGTVALLACDPSEFEFEADPNSLYTAYIHDCGRISLADDHLYFKNMSCADVNDVKNSYSNSLPNDIGNIFASSLLYALRPPIFVGGNSAPGAVGIGLLAGQLFFDDFAATLNSSTLRPVASVPLSNIEQKMNKYLSSATKAFMSGYDPRMDMSSSLQNSFSFTGIVNATMDETVAQVTLVGNKSMIIPSILLLVIALRLLQIGLRSVFWKQSRLRQLEPFGVASVARVQKWLDSTKEDSES